MVICFPKKQISIWYMKIIPTVIFDLFKQIKF